MARIWSRPLGVTDLAGQNYWDYFGNRLVEHTNILPGSFVLDVGCGSGSSLLPAAKKTGNHGYACGIDICTH
jgi:ubiquinone/menaquinone biosynthesis C-methylase UbiE